jgi:hypothetical protein
MEGRRTMTASVAARLLFLPLSLVLVCPNAALHTKLYERIKPLVGRLMKEIGAYEIEV